MATPPTLTVPLNELKERVCKCGSEVFVQAFRLREVPAMYSPSGKPATAEIKCGYLCCFCGCSLGKVPMKDDKVIMEKDIKHA